MVEGWAGETREEKGVVKENCVRGTEKVVILGKDNFKTLQNSIEATGGTHRERYASGRKGASHKIGGGVA